MKKKRVLKCVLIVAFFIIVMMLVLFYKTKELRKDMHRMETEAYNGIFVSSFGLDYYDESIFQYNRGIPIVIADYEMKKAKDYAEYLDKAWESGNAITNIYMGIDPYKLWLEAGGKQEKWDELMELYLVRYVEAHPDVTFEIVLPYDSLQTWISMEDGEIQSRWDSYAAFVDRMDDYANVVQYYLGSQEWLIANPGNYIKEQVNETVARRIMLLCFCDRAYVISSGNAETFRKELENHVTEEREAPSAYADLADYAVVFFGDSIFAYERGSHSVSGVLEGLTGAESFDLSIGGTAASGASAKELAFPYVVEGFINGEDISEGNQSNYAAVFQDFLTADLSQKRLVFVFNYGVNDYFNGWPVSTDNPLDRESYMGAMRTGITQLKEAYPQAEFVLVTPMYTDGFSGGQEILCEDGSGRVLKDYVDAAKGIAKELGIYCLDNYNEFAMDASNYWLYLTDGTHPNEYGRFVLGERLARFIGENLATQK